MVLSSTIIERLRDYISTEMEEKTFEEILEVYDLLPEDVFVLLFNQGLIDEEILLTQSQV